MLLAALHTCDKVEFTSPVCHCFSCRTRPHTPDSVRTFRLWAVGRVTDSDSVWPWWGADSDSRCSLQFTSCHLCQNQFFSFKMSCARYRSTWAHNLTSQSDAESITCVSFVDKGERLRLHDPRLPEVLWPLLRQQLPPGGLLHQPRPAYGNGSVAAAAPGGSDTALHARVTSSILVILVCTRVTSMVMGGGGITSMPCLEVTVWGSLNWAEQKVFLKWRKQRFCF